MLLRRNWFLNALGLSAVVYASACLAVYMSQSRILYAPQKVSVETMRSSRWRLVEDDRAIQIDPAGPVRAIALIFHGNAGFAAHRAFFAPELSAAGVKVLLAEYPGYGWRDGAASEQILVEDALSLFDSISARAQRVPVFLIGESLGSGVAIQVAARAKIPPSALVLVTPYSSIEDVAKSKFPWLPVGLMLRDKFDSKTYLPKYSGPVSIIIAGADEVVGADSGRTLARASLSRELQILELPGAGHNTWRASLPASYWAKLVRRLTDRT